jgi:hyperosmotically inducible periplasmic protein
MRISPTMLKITVALLMIVAFMPGCRSMTGRSAGRVIDDKTISTQVKAKLVAEKASNMTRVGVTTVNGVVHLDGIVDSVQDKVRAEEIARGVKGVTQVVDNIQVSNPAASPGSTK